MKIHCRGQEPTWIHRVAVGAPVVARNRADKIVHGLFIAKLVALTEADDHGHGEGLPTQRGSSR